MTDKFRPWVPAIFCAVLSVLTIVGKLMTKRLGVEVAFYCFLPLSFYLTGVMLLQLRHQNADLKRRLDEISSAK